jgi:hypothetical protein
VSLDVMCAICGEEVQRGELDPCAVILVAKWLDPEDQQREQQFFAHAECLRGAMHPVVRDEARVLDPQESNDQNLWTALGLVMRTGAPSRG